MPEVVPCRGPLGARIERLDRSSAGEPETAALLNRALAEHLLVVVPGERMTPPQTLAFALHDSPVGTLAWIVEK